MFRACRFRSVPGYLPGLVLSDVGDNGKKAEQKFLRRQSWVLSFKLHGGNVTH
jgi:hypothetical protein